MICYRDMTFCRESTCAKFGDGDDDCPRSLTPAVEHMAAHWWNRGVEGEKEAPIFVFIEEATCYEVKE